MGTDFDHIHYCSVCDGAAYAGKEVLVVGGGNSGFDEAKFLLSLGVARITIVEALERCCASEMAQDQVKNRDNVEVKTSTLVTGVAREGLRGRVKLESCLTGQTEEILVDGIFVFIGQKAKTDLFRGSITLDDQGYIVTGAHQETSLPGVYAAGDVVRKDYRYLTTAMADGTIAALASAEFIRDMP